MAVERKQIFRFLRAVILPIFFGGFMALVFEPERYDAERVKGKNRIFFCGRTLAGADWWRNLYTLLLIISVSVLYAVFGGGWTTGNNPGLGIFLLVVTKVLVTMTISAWILAALSDPGIIPRSNTPPEDLPQDLPPGHVALKEVVINSVTVGLIYCGTCQIWRPPRSSHCRICDNCVEVFDHHCTWLGNCIGSRNYGWFYLFVLYTDLLAAFTLWGSILFLVGFSNETAAERGVSGVEGLNIILSETPASVVLVCAIICFIALLAFVPLLILHTRLIYANKTTKEHITKKSWENGKPYEEEEGCKHCGSVLCSERKESMVWKSYNPAAGDPESGKESDGVSDENGLVNDQAVVEVVVHGKNIVEEIPELARLPSNPQTLKVEPVRDQPPG